jgi:O-antigen/teichoic acid export membrane protein
MADAISGRGSVHRVARGGVIAFFIYGVGYVLTYCSQLVIARVVGVEVYGVYAYAFAWVVVLAYVSALGFDVGLLRFVPAYEADRAWPLLRGVIQYAQRRALLVSFFIIMLGIFVVGSWTESPDLQRTFFVGLALVPILALVRIQCSAVRAFGAVVSALVPDRVIRDGALVGLLVVATLGLGWTLDAPFVMGATVVSSVLGLVCAGYAMRRHRPRIVDDIFPAYDAATWRRAAIPLVILGATECLVNRTGVILLGWMGSTKDAGIYSLAFNIALVVMMPRVAMNTLFAPAISDLYARSDRESMQVLITRIASWTFCAGFCIAAALFVLADPLFAWFGPGYETGAPALRILLFGQLMVASAGSQLYVMTMTGHERAAAVLLVCCASLNAVASAVLIDMFGLNGAAIGTAVSLVVWNLAMALYLWRRLSLLPGVLSRFRALAGKKPSVMTDGRIP